MKLSKVLSAVVMIVMFTAAVSNIVLAGPVNPGTITPVTPSDTGLKTMGQQIIGIIQLVGSILAVAVLVVLGVKYMMGSAEEKAEYKKTLLPYVIGAILVFAASNIAGIVFNTVSNIGATPAAK